MFTAFHERGVIFCVHVSALQSLIFHNLIPQSVSMSHTELHSRITKSETKIEVKWRRIVGQLRKRDFKNMHG